MHILEELTANMFAKLLTNTELLYIQAVCKDELTNLEDVNNLASKVENFKSITKPIEVKMDGYKNLIDILSKSFDMKE